MESVVHALKLPVYDAAAIAAALPREVFAAVKPGHVVVLKPNWVSEASKKHPDQWEQVITHPAVITAVIEVVLEQLEGRGRIVVIDGPTTETSFSALIAHYPVQAWQRRCDDAGVALEIIDLREHEWTVREQVVVARKELPGDPRGKVVVDLQDDASEFFGHHKSQRGYYGADYDIAETNRAHDGHQNLYSVSRSVMEADVFINLPKLKTHRKAGITCNLKNLVGINTYKNYLPHHSEGGPSEGGDQFPRDNVNAKVEGPLMAVLKQRVLKRPRLARAMAPLNRVGRRIFGETEDIVRSGNWYGNDTIWRMVLDLNKVLLYAEVDGTLREDDLAARKVYIGVIDAILAGDGNGPLSPGEVPLGRVLCGTNPVALDAAGAAFMRFDPRKIPSITKAFAVRRFRLCDFSLDDVRIAVDGASHGLFDLPEAVTAYFEPQFGWKGHIERGSDVAPA